MIIRKRNGEDCNSFTFQVELGAADARKYAKELYDAITVGMEAPLTASFSEYDFRYPIEHSSWPLQPFRIQEKHLKQISAFYFKKALGIGVIRKSATESNTYYFTELVQRRSGRPTENEE